VGTEKGLNLPEKGASWLDSKRKICLKRRHQSKGEKIEDGKTHGGHVNRKDRESLQGDFVESWKGFICRSKLHETTSKWAVQWKTAPERKIRACREGWVIMNFIMSIPCRTEKAGRGRND